MYRDESFLTGFYCDLSSVNVKLMEIITSQDTGIFQGYVCKINQIRLNPFIIKKWKIPVLLTVVQ